MAADTPVVTTEFDDGGRLGTVRAARIEDEGDAVAELVKDLVAAFAGGGAGKIGACAGERVAYFGDQIADDFVFGPAQGNASGVGSDLQRKTIGRVDDDSERAGPTSVGESIEIVRKISRKDLRKNQGVDEDRKGAVLGASFDAKDFLDGSKIDRIRGEGIERVGRNGNDGTTI